jgi:hypothetical protein
MRRIKRKPTYKMGELTFEGRTLTEAKQNAMAHAASMMTGDYTPKMIEWRGHLLFFWRGLYSWEYRITPPDVRPIEGCELTLWGSSLPNLDKTVAWNRAKFHLAQTTWTHDDGLEVPGFITESEHKEELSEYFAWQLRYRDFRNEGYTDVQCHALASGWTVDAAGRTVPQTAKVA